MARARWAALCLTAALTVCGAASSAAPAGAQTATCAFPVLSLEQITQQSSAAVVVSVTRESGDPLDGYTSTLKIEGALKGLPPGPAMKLDGLGHPGGDCSGGPRLSPGPLYVLFLTKLDGAPPAQAAYALTDGDESVYALGSTGTIFPAEKVGGAPQLQPVAPAAFARDVGTVAGTDSTRIEQLIAALGLPETIDGAAAPVQAQATTTSGPPRWLPSRAIMLVVGIGALTLALVVVLLWQPREQHPR